LSYSPYSDADRFRRIDPTIDPFADPAMTDGVLWRRPLAYAVDLLIIALLCAAIGLVFFLVTVVTFGLLHVVWVFFPFIPFAYHTLTIGGPHSATLGMRLFGLDVRSWTGARPSYVQAALQTALFYATVVPTGSLILLVALVTPKHRTLHDMLSGTYVLRARHDAVVIPPRWRT
jgi:uncharacterized RDD family membrane protein YckC